MSVHPPPAPVTLDVVDGVAHLTLNRPERANAVDMPGALVLSDVVDRIVADETVKAVVLTGKGQRFCAGGNVASIGSAMDAQSYIRELADLVDRTMQRLSARPVVIVAGVQGAVAGAGMSLMLSADIIVASRPTSFRTAYSAIGLTPDVGLSWLLPRAVGQVRALDLLLTGRVIDADTALSWGLVTEVVDTDPGDRAREIARRVAESVPGALGHARRLVRESWSATRAETGADETATIAALVESDEAKRLIAGFGTS